LARADAARPRRGRAILDRSIVVRGKGGEEWGSERGREEEREGKMKRREKREK